jgi:hypothetical protein
VVDWQFNAPPYFIEMDYAPHGNLVQWAKAHGGIQKIKLGLRLKLVAQVAEALGLQLEPMTVAEAQERR